MAKTLKSWGYYVLIAIDQLFKPSLAGRQMKRYPVAPIAAHLVSCNQRRLFERQSL